MLGSEIHAVFIYFLDFYQPKITSKNFQKVTLYRAHIYKKLSKLLTTKGFEILV